MENARISDELDFAAISGWESTAIENHSGIVDNLRNFKCDPAPITGTLLPVRPVAKQRAMCTAQGESATFDLFLLNDTSKPVSGTLTFSAVTPSGKLLQARRVPCPCTDAGCLFVSGEGGICHAAARRRRDVSLQVRAIECAARDADERDLGERNQTHFESTAGCAIVVSPSPAFRRRCASSLERFDQPQSQSWSLRLHAGRKI